MDVAYSCGEMARSDQVERRFNNSQTNYISLSQLFARFGLPKQLVSDNGVQFASTDFQNFVSNEEYYIRSFPSITHGQAERFVQTFKKGDMERHGRGTRRLR